jgi:hypothetical protein
MFEKAIQGKAASGFASGMKDKKLAEALKGESGFFYLNFDEALKVLNNLISAFGGEGEEIKTHPAMLEILPKLEYLLFTNKVDGNSFCVDYILKTRFTEPFFIAIKDLIQQMKTKFAEEE